jgi:hypothetical protein
MRRGKRHLKKSLFPLSAGISARDAGGLFFAQQKLSHDAAESKKFCRQEDAVRILPPDRARSRRLRTA